MNRFGWLILLIFFAVGVLAFWSSERHSTASLPAPSSNSSVVSEGVGTLTIPVAGVTADRLVDNWEQARDNGARVHQAIDIPAPLGTPVVAAIPGRVEKLHLSNLGGITAYVRADSGRWLTYYAHLSGYAPGLHEGQAVTAGQTIGFVGDTGNAGMGNTHLHFALHRMAPGDRWYQGAPVNPFPLLSGPLLARRATAR